MSALLNAFVLPPDVVLMPVEELPPDMRKQVTCKDGDFALTRPRARAPSKIIDAQAAALLREFRPAKTIVNAIVSYSLAQKADAHQTLEAAMPLLKTCIASRLLVPEDSPEAAEIQPAFAAGARIGDWEVVQAIQVVEDTELHHVRKDGSEAVIKVLRSHDRQDCLWNFEREIALLSELSEVDGKVTPRLLGEGEQDGRRFLVMELIDGVPPHMMAEEYRSETPPGRLRELCAAIVEAYAELHAQGVIHGDVHPRNLIVDAANRVRIVDLGLARSTDPEHRYHLAPRGGVSFYYEPEYAKSGSDHAPPPQASAAGEQYAVACILYELVTSKPYLNFSLAQQEQLRQVSEDAPLSFAAHDRPEWPAMENVLRRALSKRPDLRFESMTAFAAALREVSDAGGSAATRTALTETTAAAEPVADTGAIIADILGTLEPTGELFQSAMGGENKLPTPAVNYGAAGIAYALLRVASRRDDPHLLSLADLWAGKASSVADDQSIFYNSRLDASEDTIGKVALYHTATGVHCVQALVSIALGDVMTAERAIERFVAAARQDCTNLDLTLGRSGVLLGCALLAEREPAVVGSKDAPLALLGEEIAQGIWSEVDRFAAVDDCSELNYLGMAHGWAGVLFAQMRWAQVVARAGRPMDSHQLDRLRERLEQLGLCALRNGRGSVWPWQNKHAPSTPGFMAGWCNGSAGYVHLWTLADSMFDSPAFRDLAIRAGWSTLEQRGTMGNLCCGLAGRAYALLNLYQHTGERVWLRHATDLATRAATTGRDTIDPAVDVNGLYKGDIGLLVLLSDLDCPGEACMPMFERER